MPAAIVADVAPETLPEIIAPISPAEAEAPVSVAPPVTSPAPHVDFLMMPADARIMFITTGGAELRADWTEAAKTNFNTHMASKLEAAGKSRIPFDPARHEADEDISQLLLLWDVVAASTGTPMPHKGKKLDSNQKLTLGKSAIKLADAYGADKAIFVSHYSQIESGGVFLTQVMIGAATGYVPPSANVRATSTRIVDLKTGDILSTGSAFGGDARDPEESGGITTRMLKSISFN
ncbi:hypothetical protein [Hyphomonas sp.]|uniref:hypothetical protein n=1 Tax=Hyphomonas sp. TaxID=87 RepID=UPI003919C673